MLPSGHCRSGRSRRLSDVGPGRAACRARLWATGSGPGRLRQDERALERKRLRMTGDGERIEVVVTYVRQAQRIGAPVEELRELANSALEAIRVVGDRAATL